MCIGSWTRAEVARGIDSRGHSFSKSKANGVPAPCPAFTSSSSQQHSQPLLSVIFGGPASISPCSSRDNSPLRSRQVSGLSATSELTSEFQVRSSSFSDLVGQQIMQEQKTAMISPSVLEKAPSFAYERGQRALWLDRHHSLRLAWDDEALSPKHVLKQTMAEAATDCLKYGPKWNTSKSLLWTLAENHLLPDAPHGPASQQPTQSPPEQPAGFSFSSTLPTSSSPMPQSEQQPEQRPASRFPKQTTQQPEVAPARSEQQQHPARPMPPQLPAGIGPTGLSTTTSSPSRRFRRAALCILAKGRLEMRRTAAEHEEASLALLDTPTPHRDVARGVHNSPQSSRNGGGSGDVAWTGADSAPSPSSPSSSPPPPPSPSPTPVPTRRLRNYGSGSNQGGMQGDVALVVSDAVAKAVTDCPVGRRLVRRRVQAVVTGMSVLYAAFNLGDSLAALVHADFSHDFGSSTKAVLDFIATAPSVGNLASELIQIGVAVGLGVAQRRTPDI